MGYYKILNIVSLWYTMRSLLFILCIVVYIFPSPSLFPFDNRKFVFCVCESDFFCKEVPWYHILDPT